MLEILTHIKHLYVVWIDLLIHDHTLTSVRRSRMVKLDIPEMTKFEKVPLIRIFPALLSSPIESIFSGSPGGNPSSATPTEM